MGFDFIKTNDNLKIVCYEAYEENQGWGGGFLYGHALAEVEIKVPVAIQNINEEILEKLRQDDEFKESFAKLNMDKNLQLVMMDLFLLYLLTFCVIIKIKLSILTLMKCLI